MEIEPSTVCGGGLCPMESCLSCIYCWNDKINNMRGYDKYDLGIDENVAELARQVWRDKIPKIIPEDQCQFYYVEEHWLQYATKCEPFHEALFGLPKMILQTLAILDLGKNLRILSKRDYRKYLEFVPAGTYCGVSFTTWDKKISKVIEWSAAAPGMRLAVLKEASKKGFETWISAEPMLEGADLAKFVRKFPKTRQVYVGILSGARVRQHPDLGEIEIPALRKPEIKSQFREAVQEAKEHAPHMQLFLKNGLGKTGKRGQGLQLTKRIWKEEGYFPTSIPKCSPAIGVCNIE